MVENITLGIAAYNSSQYIEDAIKHAISQDFISEILISDDSSNDFQYQQLCDIAEKHKKIKLIKTHKNLGGLENKYNVVKNSTNNWIYLLDSDNCMTENTLQSIKSIKKINLNTCYCPEKLILFHNNKSSHQEVSYDFEFNYIGLKEIKSLLKNDVKWVDWFLNTGNYFFNKNTYLNCLNEYFEDNQDETYAGDVIATSYYWFKNGGKFKIVKGFEYCHRLRSDSYWNSCGINSSQSVEKYTLKISSL